MSDFTFEIPRSEGFFNILDAVLRIEGQAHVAYLFSGTKCSIEGSASPVVGVHGHCRARINITAPVAKVHLFTDEVRSEIRRAANQVMPRTAGFRVTEIKLTPSPAQPQQVTVADLINRVNRLRNSRSEIGVRMGTAKELMETTCKVILSERNPSLTIDNSRGLDWLWEEIQKVLTLVPSGMPDASRDATRKVLDKLSSLAQNLADKELDAKRAGIAVWAASTLTTYLIDSHQPLLWQARRPKN